MTRRQLVQLAGALLLVGALVIVSLVVGVPGVRQLRADFDGFGVWAGVGFAGLYALISLSPLPASVFTFAAGALFGVLEGLVVVEVGAVTGAVVAFLLARLLGRELVQRVSNATVERLDASFARRGLIAVLGIRMLPVLPFAVVNYVSGLTSVRFSDYLVGTALGILPVSAAYVVLGAYGTKPGSVPFLIALGALVVFLAIGAATGWRSRRRRVSAIPTPVELGPEDR